MNKVLEIAVCNKVPGVMMLSVFESISGRQFVAVTFTDAGGMVKFRETLPHTPANEASMREFLADQLATHM